jgi:DNA-3-methyladenine glycosylase II
VVVAQEPSGEVTGEVHGTADVEAAWRQTQAVLSLDFDGSDFPAVGKRDPVIGNLQQRYRYLRPVCKFSAYEGAVGWVVGQRISIAQQRRIHGRMAEELGDVIEIDGQRVAAFPRPQILLEVDTFPGVSAEKMRRIHAVCAAALEGALDREHLRSMPLAAAVAQLRRIRGIGEWTAQGIVLRAAGVVDEISDDDVTKQAVQRAYGLDHLPAQREVAAIAEAWRPYRTWAVVLLHVWLRNDGGGIDRRALSR